jgi:hypothetical protein
MRFDTRLAPLGALLLAVSGCSGGKAASDSDIGDTSLVSRSGALHIDVASAPKDAPIRGSNRIYFDVSATDGGEPVDGLAMHMVPFMPAMGHGSGSEPSSSELGAGRYEFDDVLLTMPGVWELRTAIDGTESDYVVPRFDVP